MYIVQKHGVSNAVGIMSTHCNNTLVQGCHLVVNYFPPIYTAANIYTERNSATSDGIPKGGAMCVAMLSECNLLVIPLQ